MKHSSLIVIIAVLMIPLVYLAVVYQALPETVAIHFSIDGTPDRYSNKRSLLLPVILLSVIALGVYLLVTNIEKIDPKKAANQSKETMQKLGLAMVLLFTTINISCIYGALQNGFTFSKIMLPLLGLFFAFTGNLMNSIKPNYFVGIRTPWTIEDEDTWRKTHRLAGKMWFAGGLLITILTLATPAKPAFIIMLSVVAIITIIPVIYSYRYFRSHKG